jgi:predicted esterase
MKLPASLILLVFCAHLLFSQHKYDSALTVKGFEYIEFAKVKEEKLPLLIAFHYSGGNPFETISDYDSYQKDSLTQFAISKITVDSLARFVKSIEKKYNQKAIVSGISQGGDIAFLMAKYYPELCKAAFCFAAVIHSDIVKELKDKPVRKIPIYMFQGEDDKIVSVLATKRKVKEIGERLQLKLYTYPGLGHDISPQMKIDYSTLWIN